MNSSMFQLNGKDFAKGAAVAVLAAVFTQLSVLLSDPSFAFTSLNWEDIGRVAIAAFVAYIAKNYFSNDSGKVFGKIG